jgi:hypothetical protein
MSKPKRQYTLMGSPISRREMAEMKLALRASQRRSKRNPTKSQKRARAAKSAKQRGIIKAVRGLLKKTNPSARIVGAKVVKLKDGVLKITPVKANRGRASGF